MPDVEELEKQSPETKQAGEMLSNIPTPHSEDDKSLTDTVIENVEDVPDLAGMVTKVDEETQAIIDEQGDFDRDEPTLPATAANLEIRNPVVQDDTMLPAGVEAALAAGINPKDLPSNQVNAVLARAMKDLEQGNAISTDSMPNNVDTLKQEYAEMIAAFNRADSERRLLRVQLDQHLTSEDRVAVAKRQLEKVAGYTGDHVKEIKNMSVLDGCNISTVYANEVKYANGPKIDVILQFFNSEGALISTQVMQNTYIKTVADGFYELVPRMT